MQFRRNKAMATRNGPSVYPSDRSVGDRGVPFHGILANP